MVGLIVIAIVSAVAAGVVSAHLTKNKVKFQKYDRDSKKEPTDEDEYQPDSGFDVTVDL